MELVEDLKDELIDIINKNQEEKIIVFKEGFMNNNFKYRNIKTNEIIEHLFIEEVGSYFACKFKDYVVVEHKIINEELNIYCEEMQEVV